MFDLARTGLKKDRLATFYVPHRPGERPQQLTAEGQYEQVKTPFPRNFSGAKER